MPPRLALFGGIVFLIWGFRKDAKFYPYPTGTLWLPALWLMRCGSRGIDYWMGGSDANRWDPILLAVLIACGAIALARRRCQWGGVIAHNSALFLFYAYIAISLTWVQSLEDPAIKIMRPLGDLIMALLVATEPNPRLAIMTMFRRAAIPLIPLSIVLVKYFPDLGRMQDKHWGNDSWIGVTTHKNPLGQLCLMAALGFIWTLAEARRNGQPLKRQWFVWLYLALTFHLFLDGGPQSLSSTAIFCCGLALVLFFGLGYMRDRIQMVVRRIVLSVVALVALALVLQLLGTSLQGVVAESFGKNPTLSDRTYLWNDVVRLGAKNPILGTGYGGFWVRSIYAELSPMVDNKPEEAHNGYLETYANLGLVGVALLAFVIIQSIRSSTRLIHTDFEYGRMRLCMIFTVVVMNYSEATFPRGTHLWWFGFLIFAVYAREWVYWPEAAMTTDDPAST
jgi:O-antigen ligase